MLLRRETANTLAVQLIELEVERADLQVGLYDMLRSGSGSVLDMRRGLEGVSKISARIHWLGEELRRADARSATLEESA